MAGHSKFANIKHRKGAQDKKRAKVFTKALRQVLVAAKQGMPDPEMNPALRSAIAEARSLNVPKDRIEAAIKKASSGNDNENYDAMRYEGYGPSGVAVLVEALTDNRNRTASDVRSAFTKHAGNLGESGSVSYMFDRLGLVVYSKDIADDDAMLEAALEAGAEECNSDNEGHEITCIPEQFSEMRDYLVKKFGDPEIARVVWKPNMMVSLAEDKMETLRKLIDVLEENDDVQEIYHNFDGEL